MKVYESARSCAAADHRRTEPAHVVCRIVPGATERATTRVWLSGHTGDHATKRADDGTRSGM